VTTNNLQPKGAVKPTDLRTPSHNFHSNTKTFVKGETLHYYWKWVNTLTLIGTEMRDYLAYQG